jgi:hypothetical protein
MRRHIAYRSDGLEGPAALNVCYREPHLNIDRQLLAELRPSLISENDPYRSFGDSESSRSTFDMSGVVRLAGRRPFDGRVRRLPRSASSSSDKRCRALSST